MQESEIYVRLELPTGEVWAASDGTALTGLHFGKCPYETAEEDEVLRQTKAELLEYFRGERKHFSVPVNPKGTEFQKKVWKALQEIPYGETRSYKEIAERTGNPKACRAVGMANNRNPIAIIIPCHRVVGADGTLTGYAGGLDVKKYLLDMENGKK